MNKAQNFNGSVIPMFLPHRMEQAMASNDQTQLETTPQLSVFDVKELYDMAYALETTDEAKFKSILAQAVKLDLEYRRQLTKRAAYKDTSKERTFNDAGNGADISKKTAQG